MAPPVVAQQPAFLTNGLVAYYPFNGNANDEISVANNFDKSPQFTSDRFGRLQNAADFLNSSPINSGVLPVKTHTVTVSFWLNIVRAPSYHGERVILHGSHNVGVGDQKAATFGFAIWPDGRPDGVGVSFLKSDLTGGRIGLPSGTLSLNKWCHIAVTSAGGFVGLYIDGVLAAEEAGQFVDKNISTSVANG